MLLDTESPLRGVFSFLEDRWITDVFSSLLSPRGARIFFWRYSGSESPQVTVRARGG